MKMQSKCAVKLIIIALAMLATNLVACTTGNESDDRIVVRLAAPQSAYIEDFETNQYKLWLEEQTGFKIEMTWLPKEDAEQIAIRQLQTGEDLPDAYIGFGSSSYDIFGQPNIQRYGELGAIIPLNDYIQAYGTYTNMIFDELHEYNLPSLMTSADGQIYFMPGFSSSIITRHRQILWLNKGWLDRLGLNVPETTDELKEVLLSFKNEIPNSKPLIGTEAHYGKQAYEFIINAFIYNDTVNTRLIVEGGKLVFAPTQSEWRDALRYLHELYTQGLYSPYSFTQDNQQMNQMAVDGRDIVGAFMSPGITLTVPQSSPEILERYIGIGPLEGPDGVRWSTVITPLPRPNGVITSACEHPEEVFKLFDLMLSEEACLMGRYGERGIDWDFAQPGEVSIFGTPATIHIIHQLWNTLQNKHLAQIGPYVSRPKFSGGVTWDGSLTDGEYMNAQAALLHVDYAPDEYVRTLIFTPDEEYAIQQVRSEIEKHVSETIIGFMTGARDIDDDAEWQRYINEFTEIGLYEFMRLAQKAHDRLMG